MNDKLSAFFKMIVKYGGANLIIFLVSAWFFDTYFHIKEGEVADKLSWLLTAIFIETVYVMLVSRVIWTMEKFRDFGKGKDMKEEMNGKPVVKVLQDIGLDTVINLTQKGAQLRANLAETKDEKKKDKLRAEIEALELELEEAELEAI